MIDHGTPSPATPELLKAEAALGKSTPWNYMISVLSFHFPAKCFPINLN